MKLRLDEYLTQKQLCKSRSQAKLVIDEGRVLLNGQPCTKPAQMISTGDHVKIIENDNFASRGAYKLKAAIEGFDLTVKDKVVADIGACSGGFSDLLLRHGAAKVYAIDVGHGQMDPRLLKDSRLINLEKTDIRKDPQLGEAMDLVVSDLSHISLRLALPHIFSLARDGADIICLFKPQFELAARQKLKRGVINDEQLHSQLLAEFQLWCKENHYQIQNIMPSPITGKLGNKEFLIHFRS